MEVRCISDFDITFFNVRLWSWPSYVAMKAKALAMTKEELLSMKDCVGAGDCSRVGSLRKLLWFYAADVGDNCVGIVEMPRESVVDALDCDDNPAYRKERQDWLVSVFREELSWFGIRDVTHAEGLLLLRSANTDVDLKVGAASVSVQFRENAFVLVVVHAP